MAAEVHLAEDALCVLHEALDQIGELVMVLRDRLVVNRAEEAALGNAVAALSLIHI